MTASWLLTRRNTMEYNGMIGTINITGLQGLWNNGSELPWRARSDPMVIM